MFEPLTWVGYVYAGKKVGLGCTPQPRSSLEPLNLMLLPRER